MTEQCKGKNDRYYTAEACTCPACQEKWLKRLRSIDTFLERAGVRHGVSELDENTAWVVSIWLESQRSAEELAGILAPPHRAP